MHVPKLEKQIGIEVYVTQSLGIGGIIRKSPSDFVVEELLVDGSKAEIELTHDANVNKALGSSDTRKRYLLCAMIKRNWDTLSAVKVIADQLGINVRRVQIGGIKDARATTAQFITIEDTSVEEAKKIKTKDIELRPIGYFRDELSSYYLLGNSFQIAINGINHAKNTIKKRITKTVEELDAIGGAPNFFGHQRFGTVRPITHLVGKAILKGNLKKAVMLFLARSSPYEHSNSRKAREELFATMNFEQALRNFPKQLRYERIMLKHLAEKPSDYVGALKRLPMKLQELFIQAYQSYLFNKFLSKRLESGLGLNKVEVGDYVVNIERTGLPMQTLRRIVRSDIKKEINQAIEAGRMRLAIPLSGFRQHQSQGVQGEIEKQVLEAEDVSRERFRVKIQPQFAAKGSLRVATTALKDFSVREISQSADFSSKNSAKISFTLHRGSYATIILRELMKPKNLIKAGY